MSFRTSFRPGFGSTKAMDSPVHPLTLTKEQFHKVDPRFFKLVRTHKSAIFFLASSEIMKAMKFWCGHEYHESFFWGGEGWHFWVSVVLVDFHDSRRHESLSWPGDFTRDLPLESDWNTIREPAQGYDRLWHTIENCSFVLQVKQIFLWTRWQVGTAFFRTDVLPKSTTPTEIYQLQHQFLKDRPIPCLM